MTETLLLTGTFKPFKELNKTGYNSASVDYEVREKEYFDSLVYYITQTNFSKIVFVENSKSNFKDEHMQIIDYLIKSYQKQFEYISFLGDKNMIKEKGYNYGEGECIDYAFENSLLLNNSKNWYKITGRYKYLI